MTRTRRFTTHKPQGAAGAQAMRTISGRQGAKGQLSPVLIAAVKVHRRGRRSVGAPPGARHNTNMSSTVADKSETTTPTDEAMSWQRTGFTAQKKRLTREPKRLSSSSSRGLTAKQVALRNMRASRNRPLRPPSTRGGALPTRFPFGAPDGVRAMAEDAPDTTRTTGCDPLFRFHRSNGGVQAQPIRP